MNHGLTEQKVLWKWNLQSPKIFYVHQGILGDTQRGLKNLLV